MTERFTERVRQELARQPIADASTARAELTALLRFAGRLTIVGGAARRVEISVESTSGAVARRVYTLVQHRFGLRPELSVRLPDGLRSSRSYRVRIDVGAVQVAEDLGIVDHEGRPVDAAPTGFTADVAAAFARGAMLGAGSLSSPERQPHAEIVATTVASAAALAVALTQLLGVVVRPTDEERPRVVIKSGERIGELLATLGAPQAFLEWDDQRLRRQLRSDATRLANADRANLRRSIEASATQVAAVERAVQTVGWDGLDDELRSIALARLANPDASLTELGELLDPPIGKSAVHRRLRRLEAIAAGSEGLSEGGPTDP